RVRSWSLLYAPEASSVPRGERALIPSGVPRGLNNVRCPGSYLAPVGPLGVVRSIDVGDVLFPEGDASYDFMVGFADLGRGIGEVGCDDASDVARRIGEGLQDPDCGARRASGRGAM